MTAWLFLAAAAWAVLSVLIGLLVDKWLSSPRSGAGDDCYPRSSSALVLDSARRARRTA
jgi:hypothetical protein